MSSSSKIGCIFTVAGDSNGGTGASDCAHASDSNEVVAANSKITESQISIVSKFNVKYRKQVNT